MNLLLFTPQERQQDIVTINDPVRVEHLSQVLKVKLGQLLRVGELGGQLGQGEVLALQNGPPHVTLRVQLNEPPPKSLNLSLVLALPRPKALGRMLESITELGVKNIYLIGANKVEKSYWQAHQLRPDQIQKHLWQGLSLARDTVLPRVQLSPLFRPFAEDILPQLSAHSARWVAHPQSPVPLFSQQSKTDTTLCIGPEGGWTDFELKLLIDQGFQLGHFGERILSSETAATALVAAFASR